MPEIINFSNRIAYEPENIRLIPVRQYGADRLEPIKPVLVDGGYVRGTTYKTNPPEAEAIAEQIVACTQNPRYNGLTFGVISLQGPHQAKAIERLLLDRLEPAEWERRDLRCGDSADFQGSERDVMFLSMVTAVEPGTRIGAATTEMYVQRYNVAASRAKDQMWVFHSVRPSDLGNPNDMRHQLLDYCYGVAARPAELEGTDLPPAVPEDVLVAPFDSLFEQRVYNRITGRGFSVVPQFEALGYVIDLVVVGPQSRLAVECDGDTWPGPDRHGPATGIGEVRVEVLPHSAVGVRCRRGDGSAGPVGRVGAARHQAVGLGLRRRRTAKSGYGGRGRGFRRGASAGSHRGGTGAAHFP